MADDVGTSQFEAWVRRFGALVSEHRDELTDLDRAIGDADHGSNLDRGMKAAVAALDGLDDPTPGALLKKVGMTLVSTVGGASGPLFGTLFLRLGTGLGDAASASDDQVAAAFRAGLEGVQARGKAELGDKTMYDALSPAVDELDAALGDGASLGDALVRARDAAATGRDATIAMVARKGRASYLGERSVDHQDPGATSVTLLLEAAAETLG